ncbi:MAG: hypothetical protein AAGU11_18040 [Syntrophobacteraceae bacterium]
MEKRERIIHANQVFCDECSRQGIKVCSWEAMPGWDGFVNGSMGETDLSAQAREEMAQFNRTFDRYSVVNEEPAVDEEKAAKMKKAKAANKIYKKACTDSGKSLCFFKNFTSWQEFVEGRIGDEELYDQAVQEVEKLKVEQQQV